VPDTYADAHVTNSAREAGSAATHAAANKNTKYNQLFNTHVFFPVVIETWGTSTHLAPSGGGTGTRNWKIYCQHHR